MAQQNPLQLSHQKAGKELLTQERTRLEHERAAEGTTKMAPEKGTEQSVKRKARKEAELRSPAARMMTRPPWRTDKRRKKAVQRTTEGQERAKETRSTTCRGRSVERAWTDSE